MRKAVDDGYIELVNCMGDDLTVVNSARVSYGRHKDELDDKDAKLIRYLAKHKHHAPYRHVYFSFRVSTSEAVARQWYKHCYSPDTEVLTDRGWKFWPDVVATDKLAAVDTSTSSYSFEEPVELIEQDFTGDMVSFKSNTVDLAVTDQHRMIVHKRNKADNTLNLEVRTARECLSGEYKLPLQPTLSMPTGTRADFYEGKLLGLFLGDGSVAESRNNTTVVFKLKKARKIADLKEVCTQLGIELRQGSTSANGVHSFRLPNPNKNLFKGSAKVKEIPFDNLHLTRQLCEGLYEGLLKSDGTITASGSHRFTTSSEKLLNSLHRLCDIIGREYSTYFHPTGQWAMTTMLQREHRHLSVCDKEVYQYTGKVYCATVSTGALLVRRGGKKAVCGNCVGANFTSEDTRVVDHGFSEISGRYVDISKDLHVPTAFRAQHESSKQASLPDSLITDKRASEVYNNTLKACQDAYDEMISLGVCKEQARMLIPTSFKTTFIWTCSLEAAVNFIKLRDHEGAQWEIRKMAMAMRELIEPICPVSVAALLSEY